MAPSPGPLKTIVSIRFGCGWLCDRPYSGDDILRITIRCVHAIIQNTYVIKLVNAYVNAYIEVKYISASRLNHYLHVRAADD